MGKQQPEMIRGTLDMLIMKVLSLGPMHGWGISERIQLISEEELQVEEEHWERLARAVARVMSIS